MLSNIHAASVSYERTLDIELVGFVIPYCSLRFSKIRMINGHVGRYIYAYNEISLYYMLSFETVVSMAGWNQYITNQNERSFKVPLGESLPNKQATKRLSLY